MASNQTTTSKITLDLYAKNVVAVNAKQYDDETRYIEITCVENGVIYTLDKTIMSAFLRLKKPDDNGVFNEVEITDTGKIKIVLTEQMLAASGRAIVDVFLIRRVFTSNEKPTDIDDIYKVNAPIISIMDFYINITPTALNHSQIESSYEFNALTNALAQIDFNNKKVVELDKTLTANENVRQNNENVRKSNEEQRISAENVRIKSEKQRLNAENTRNLQEATRVSNEQKRIDSENTRVSNENDRKSNEDTRKSNETQRQSNEDKRISAETKRENSETKRQSNETQREQNEKLRKNNEDQRISNEQTRVSNEKSRNDAEAERIKNENTRISNETTRQSQESKRQTDTATAITNANNAAKNANDKANDLQNKLDNNYFVLTNELENSVSSTSTTHAPTANAVKTAYDKAVSVENTINSNKNNWNDKYTKNEIDNKFSTLENNIDWKESVNTFADIAKTYPNPQDGWTVNVKDTDYTYRYSGSAWVAISANAIPKATQSVDGLLSKEDKTSLDGLKNNVVTGIKGNSETTYRKGNVNLTSQNIGALPSTGGILTGETRVTNPSYTNGYVRAWVDSEGGNFEIQSPGGKTYQIDSYNNDYLRIYSTSNDGTYKFVYFNRNTGALSCDGGFNGNAMTASKLQTYKQNSTTETYGSKYSLCAQWRDGTHLRLKCDNYTVETDYATTAGNSTTVNGHTVNSDVPANAKFTDTNTWRGIQNNLTSDSTSDSLSAAQGKALKGLVDSKAASSHGHSYNDLTNKPTLGSAASKTVRTLSASGASGWKDLGTDQGYVPDMAFMAYWNGAYSGSSSNLAYCNKGAFGTAATANKGDFATASHTHSQYLTSHQNISGKVNKSGDTLSGRITRNGGGTWISDRNNVAVFGTNSASGNYNPIVGQKTPNGSWTIGNLANSDHLVFNYTTDINYNAGNNVSTAINLPNVAGTIALTSQIPSVGNGTVTITQNGAIKGTFTMNQSGNTTIALTDTNTDTNTWRPLGTTANTACAGNDSRLSNARPASDVYSWAKQVSKPSYSWSEITGKPSSFTPASHTHDYIPTSASCNKNWNWSGKNGQPNWLWGGNDGANMYVYNPSNFSVNYANSAGSVAWSNVSGKPSNYTPSSHASTATTYGKGTATNYGHVKLTDVYTSSLGDASSGVAPSQLALYGLYNYVKTNELWTKYVSIGTVNGITLYYRYNNLGMCEIYFNGSLLNNISAYDTSFKWTNEIPKKPLNKILVPIVAQQNGLCLLCYPGEINWCLFSYQGTISKGTFICGSYIYTYK